MNRDLLTTLLFFVIVFLLIVYDVLASYNGTGEYTITSWARRLDAHFPWVKLALAFTAGLLTGHLFLGCPPDR